MNDNLSQPQKQEKEELSLVKPTNGDKDAVSIQSYQHPQLEITPEGIQPDGIVPREEDEKL